MSRIKFLRRPPWPSSGGFVSSKFTAASGCLFAVLALGVAACGSRGSAPKSDGGTAGSTLTVYSSVPLQGASRTQAKALGDGAKLAVEQAGNKAGKYTVRYVPLDNSTSQAGNWTPEATAANALRVA